MIIINSIMKDTLKELLSINYWDKNPNFKLGHTRELYITKLWNSLDNNLIKVIVGQRRTGKSVIVRQLMHKLIHEKNINRKNIVSLNGWMTMVRC